MRVAGRIVAAISFAVALSATDASYASESAYTRVRGRECIDMSKRYFGSWRCPGPAGYVIEFFDEGNLAGVNVRLGTNRMNSSSSSRWRGYGEVFGELVEWRMQRGYPTAAVLRRFRVLSDQNGDERQSEELAIFKLSWHQSCLVQIVDARQPEANILARAVADNTRAMTCIQSRD